MNGKHIRNTSVPTIQNLKLINNKLNLSKFVFIFSPQYKFPILRQKSYDGNTRHLIVFLVYIFKNLKQIYSKIYLTTKLDLQ